MSKTYWKWGWSELQQGQGIFEHQKLWEAYFFSTKISRTHNFFQKIIIWLLLFPAFQKTEGTHFLLIDHILTFLHVDDFNESKNRGNILRQKNLSYRFLQWIVKMGKYLGATVSWQKPRIEAFLSSPRSFMFKTASHETKGSVLYRLADFDIIQIQVIHGVHEFIINATNFANFCEGQARAELPCISLFLTRNLVYSAFLKFIQV